MKNRSVVTLKIHQVEFDENLLISNNKKNYLKIINQKIRDFKIIFLNFRTNIYIIAKVETLIFLLKYCELTFMKKIIVKYFRNYNIIFKLN